MTRRRTGSLRRRRGMHARRALMHLIDGTAITSSDADQAASTRHTRTLRLNLRMVLHGLLIIVSCLVILIEQPRNFQLAAPTLAMQRDDEPDSDELLLSSGFAPQVINAPVLRSEYVGAESSPRLLAPVESRPQIVVGFFRMVHRLAPGESLGEIADRYQIGLDSLIWLNGLEQGDALMPGQLLQIPHTSGLIHTIQPGEQLADLVAAYGVNEGAILGFGPNQIAESGLLEVGSALFIPGAVKPLPAELLQASGGYAGLAARTIEPAAVVLQDQTNLREGPGTEYRKRAQLDAGRRAVVIARHAEWLKVRLAGSEGWVRQDLLALAPEVLAATVETNDFPPPPPRWVWPARGTITSRFGPRWGGFHNGLDIANRAWSPIVAARSGVVREAGWCRGYGYCVKINHGGGVLTVYGHLIDQPVVRAGQEVAAGELVGHMGSTYDRAGGGYSTGVHLHFSVFINGAAVDPLRVLP